MVGRHFVQGLRAGTPAHDELPPAPPLARGLVTWPFGPTNCASASSMVTGRGPERRCNGIDRMHACMRWCGTGPYATPLHEALAPWRAARATPGSLRWAACERTFTWTRLLLQGTMGMVTRWPQPVLALQAVGWRRKSSRVLLESVAQAVQVLLFNCATYQAIFAYPATTLQQARMKAPRSTSHGPQARVHAYACKC